MEEKIVQLQNEIAELRRALTAKDALEEVYEARLHMVEEIREMKFAKLYRAASVRMGKGDPFDSVRRELKPQERIRVWIGEYIYQEEKTEIRGWAADPDASSEYLRVRAADGSIVPSLITRSMRADVNSTLSLSKERKCGFVIHFENEIFASRPLPYTLEAESASGISRIPLQIEPDREKRIAAWEKALAEKKAPSDGPLIAYDDWAYAGRLQEDELQKQRETVFDYAPVFSIVVPLFNTPWRFLNDLLKSVLSQTYSNWELCLADGSPGEGLREMIERIAGTDSRIRYRKLDTNEGIAGNTNAAIAMAGGDFLVFADHDDILTPDALFELASVLNRKKEEEIKLIYSDEDKVTKDGDYLYDPFFKPDFDPVLLTSYNYFTHLVAVQRDLTEPDQALDGAFDGAQDYDFVLRMSEKAGRAVHIPKSLYHWRAHELSTAGNSDSKDYAYENGRRALTAHLKRQGLKGQVAIGRYTGRYDVRYELPDDFSLSVILVPGKGRKAEDRSALIRKNAGTEIAEVILADARNASLPEALNRAAKEAKGTYLLFLSDRLKEAEDGFARILGGFFQREEVGAAGGRVSAANGRICSAGWLIGAGGRERTAVPAFADLSTDVFSYGGYANLPHTVTALSSDSLMTRKELFEKLGGFDTRYEEDLFDADFCIRLMMRNQASVICPSAEVILNTDQTEWSENLLNPADRTGFREKWHALIEKGDPYFNPNLDLNRSDYALKGQYI